MRLKTIALNVLAAAALAACGGPSATDLPPTDEPVAEPTLVTRRADDAAPTDTPTAEDVAPSGPPPRMASPEYGVQAFLWWRPEVAERDMLIVKDMGFGWIKQGFGWRDIEGEPGKYDWTRTDFIVDTAQRYGGLKLLVRIDHQPGWARSGCSLQGPPANMNDYAGFVRAVAKRYRGKIAGYQIWNEPNLAREWCDRSPDPGQYAEMLRLAYAAIKSVDPSAHVISAGLSPTGTQPPVAMPDDVFLDRLYLAMGGSSDGHFDVLGVHAAGFAAPPETSPAEAAASAAYGGERFFTFRRVEDLRAIQERYGDGEKQVAVLEMGWTSDPREGSPYHWHAVSEATKADYLVRAYQYAAQNWSPWIGLMSSIYVCNYDWTAGDEQYWWCIVDPDGTPRPAFETLKAMPK